MVHIIRSIGTAVFDSQVHTGDLPLPPSGVGGDGSSSSLVLDLDGDYTFFIKNINE